MFSCDLCEFVCGKEGFLKMHVQRIHEKKFICSGSAAKCDFVGRKKKELDEHLKICHKEELSTCSLCNYATVRKAVLRSHIERVHKQMKKFRCAKCNYKSYEKRDLTFHENSFHKKKFNIKCKLCRFSCLCFARLRSHKKLTSLFYIAPCVTINVNIGHSYKNILQKCTMWNLIQ